MESENKPAQPEQQEEATNSKAQFAETKLKEMSKRAKSKSKPSEPKVSSKTSMFNTNWLFYGFGLAGILGLGYLFFRDKNQKVEYRFVPANKPQKRKSSDKPAKVEDRCVALSTIPEEKPVPSFELNCF